MHRYFPLLFFLAALLSACDTTITGEELANRPPDTQLSVQDTSLVQNLGENLLTSTVFVSWSGTDPDGYVDAFEIRYYNVGQRPSPEDGWSLTQQRDSLILLPIPRGESAAQVVFEVRAVDDDDARDPEPARTVFPIKNSPPELTLSPFILPPDTTFSIFSFGWTADDPEGIANLERIEISFNDSTSFSALPPDVDFVTFVAPVERGNPDQTITSARVFTGRGFSSTELTVPGLRLNGDNVLYIRAVDATDTTSTLRRYPATDEGVWYVRKPAGNILFVNDYRKSTASTVIPYHLNLLREYLPAGTAVDVWDLSLPYATGSSGNLVTADALPAVADPTLRQLYAQWDFIYWVSTDATGTVPGNNLPLSAPMLDLFFERGGKMFVHVPIHVPLTDREVGSNPATLLLPLSALPEIPDGVRRLQINNGAAVSTAQPLPGSGITLPPLRAQSFILNALPFQVESSTIVPLYQAEYTSVSSSGRVPWTGASTVASISTDNRIALFALPLVQEQSGDPTLASPDGDAEAAREAVRLILESLGFPKR